MRDDDVQKACVGLGSIKDAATQQEASDVLRRYQPDPQTAKVAARAEWLRNMRLQSMVWGIQLAHSAKEPDGQVAVKNAQEIFDFLTKEDVN